MLSAFLFLLNVFIWSVLLYPLVFIKVMIPNQKFRRWLTQVLIRGVEIWIAGNDLNLAWTQKIKWNIEIEPQLNPTGCYVVVSNHCSWIDIIILQHIFNRKLPFLRFFLKQELIWVPLLGGVWWALDYPFMKRYSRDYLEKHPEKRGLDLITAQKALQKFKGYPVSILNFLEGTRFTVEKRDRQQSPFRFLLKPKAGGLASTLEAFRAEKPRLLDVTIVYPRGVVSFVEMCFGKLEEVIVQVKELSIPDWVLTNRYSENPSDRDQFQQWVQELWMNKDLRIQALLART